ncbi:hypothetical protein Ddc_14823 [Ditylenchus destructor]|nr:hypothetical protein Ddc_14823 [Ditylenchus destructor]
MCDISMASSQLEEAIGTGLARLDAVWVSDVYLNPTADDPLSNPVRVPSKFVHELVHMVGMIARIPDEDQWAHGPEFQLIRTELQRITGIDIPVI